MPRQIGFNEVATALNAITTIQEALDESLDIELETTKFESSYFQAIYDDIFECGFPKTVRDFLGLSDQQLWALANYYDVMTYQEDHNGEIKPLSNQNEATQNREQLKRNIAAALGIKFDKLVSNQRCDKCNH
ncbi:hypothetical protein ABW21_db0203097 [Orbilia brochopaga]|nr:hypothetical protein ABW21_db0203097 [Drechslerella brochopaga]